MRTVEDDTGHRYLLEKRSGDASRVRDPETGEVTYLPTAQLRTIDGSSPLDAVAEAVPATLRRLITATPDRAALGLLIDLSHRGPVSVRDMLADYDLCERDLHGRLAEFTVAGLVTQTTVGGERAYALTADGRAAIDWLQSAKMDG